jgi:outer membrane immunogenic protein
MKKLILAVAGAMALLSSVALADGMGSKGAVACCDAARPWTGFYVGIGGGAGSVVHDLTAGPINIDGFGGEGVFGTVMVGYDRMLTSRIVGGVFADYDFVSNVSTDISLGLSSLSAEQKNTWSVGARLGFLSSPTTLWYGTGGYSHTEFDLKGVSFSLPDFNGYFVGAGVESQLQGGWGLRAEYRFTQYDSEELFRGVSLEPSTHAGRIALTYKWGREEPAYAAPMK